MAGNNKSTVCVGLLLLGLLSGCAELDMREGMSWPGSEPKPQVPDRMTTVWTETILNQWGKPSVRGFGGRMMFYREGRDKPVPVDGTLIVYAFDNQNADPKEVSPEKKFIFPAEQLDKHYSKSKLGPSYSFWLPWDEVGGSRRQISLLARFEAREGGIIRSEFAHNTLSGTTDESAGETGLATKSDHAPTRPDNDVRQVSYETVVKQSPKKEQMSTHTIDVSPRFARNILAAPDTEQLPENASRNTTQDTNAETPAPSESRSKKAEEDSAGSGYLGRFGEPLQSARFGRQRFPARTRLAAGQDSALAPKQPRPAMWQSHLPATPRSDQAESSTEPTPIDEPGWN